MTSPRELAVNPPCSEPRSGPVFVLYVDADNQSSQCARPLLELIHNLGGEVIQAVISGNNNGREVEAWKRELQFLTPDLDIYPMVVSWRKQAADIALIIALGERLRDHLAKGERIIIVSRDDYLICAAQQIARSGCPTFAAYSANGMPPPKTPGLMTFLIPAGENETGSLDNKGAFHLGPSDMNSEPPLSLSLPFTDTPEFMSSLREQIVMKCADQGNGWYRASDVGQILLKLGIQEKKERTRFLDGIPNLKKKGEGPGLLLKFED